MIQRWRAIYPNDGGYVTEDKCGKLVYYNDHEAIVNELVEALELVVLQLESPEFEVVRDAIAKAKEGS